MTYKNNNVLIQKKDNDSIHCLDGNTNRTKCGIIVDDTWFVVTNNHRNIKKCYKCKKL